MQILFGNLELLSVVGNDNTLLLLLGKYQLHLVILLDQFYHIGIEGLYFAFEWSSSISQLL